MSDGVFQMLAGWGGAGGANDAALASLFGGGVNPLLAQEAQRLASRPRFSGADPWTYRGSTEIPTERQGGGNYAGAPPALSGAQMGGVFGMLGVPFLNTNQTPSLPKVPGRVTI